MRKTDDGRGTGREEEGAGHIKEDTRNQGQPRQRRYRSPAVICQNLSVDNVPESDHALCASSQISLR